MSSGPSDLESPLTSTGFSPPSMMSKDRGRRERPLNKSNRLRMDSDKSYSQIRVGGDEKQRELDNVMRKARESQSNYWNKKILEVEERDPNRWRHSGYKEMYIGESSKTSVKEKNLSTKSRSPHKCSPKRSSSRNTRSYRARGSRSPNPCSSHLLRNRSTRSRTSRSPRCRSPKTAGLYSNPSKHPSIMQSTSSKVLNSRLKRSHLELPRIFSAVTYSSQKGVSTSRSPSSGSTCSNESCSVCSPRHCQPMKSQSLSGSRSKSRSSKLKAHSQSGGTSTPDLITIPSKSSKPISPMMLRPRTPPPMPQPPVRHPKDYCKLTKDLKARKENHQSQLPKDPRVPESVRLIHEHIKVENTHGVDTSLQNSSIDSTPTDESDSSSSTSHAPPPRMTLSERFGRMAQWSVDRRDMENMRITKVGNKAMKVVIEGDRRINRLEYDSSSPGLYPDALSPQGPRGLECWDDVRVRYEYYKSRGYLRDLDLEDYIKWEEWWYKYQEWLEAERYYEQWASQTANRPGGGNRKRRRRNTTAH